MAIIGRSPLHERMPRIAIRGDSGRGQGAAAFALIDGPVLERLRQCTAHTMIIHRCSNPHYDAHRAGLGTQHLLIDAALQRCVGSTECVRKQRWGGRRSALDQIVVAGSSI